MEKIIMDFQLQERLFDRMYGIHVMNISFATHSSYGFTAMGHISKLDYVDGIISFFDHDGKHIMIEADDLADIRICIVSESDGGLISIEGNQREIVEEDL